jgi:hypothetical protein
MQQTTCAIQNKARDVQGTTRRSTCRRVLYRPAGRYYLPERRVPEYPVSTLRHREYYAPLLDRQLGGVTPTPRCQRCPIVAGVSVGVSVGVSAGAGGRNGAVVVPEGVGHFGGDRPEQVAAERVGAAVAAVLREPRDCTVECSVLTWAGRVLRCVATCCTLSREVSLDTLNAKQAACEACRSRPQGCTAWCTLHAARCMVHVSCPSRCMLIVRTEHRRRDQPESSSWERVPRELLRAASILRNLSFYTSQ